MGNDEQAWRLGIAANVQEKQRARQILAPLSVKPPTPQELRAIKAKLFKRPLELMDERIQG